MLYVKPINGVCAREIQVVLTDGIIMGVNFVGGCDGQSKTLNMLLSGQKPQSVIDKMKQVECGSRNSSCAKELALFLEEIVNG